MTKPYYEDDYVTLYHGDCLEVTDWLAADVLVTDPPYGRDWKGTTYNGGAGVPGIAGDKDTSTRDAVLRLWGMKRPAVAFGDLLIPTPDETRQVLIYAKPPGAGFQGAFGGFFRDAEAIYLIGAWSSLTARSTSVLRSSAPFGGFAANRYQHPHAKPIDLMERLIEASHPGVIADPFAGSGSTLVAARNLGRKAIGVELEEKYCELIVSRLSQQAFDFTALEPRSPELRSSGWPQHDSEDGLFREWAP